MNLTANCPALINSAGIWSIPCWAYRHKFLSASVSQ